mmetsp:Transcript_24638/g.38739  ORF Transcript_24638/g.38739 Transcript_24638/m.38739 type:complete len:110 (-) Transcript_24638:102-431(-)
MNSQDFLDSVWKDQPLYIDETDGMRTAMGDHKYELWWLLKPATIGQVLFGGLPKSGGFSDVNEKTKKLGGEIVVGRGQILWQRREDSDFQHSSVDDLLDAVKRAKDIYK